MKFGIRTPSLKRSISARGRYDASACRHFQDRNDSDNGSLNHETVS